MNSDSKPNKKQILERNFSCRIRLSLMAADDQGFLLPLLAGQVVLTFRVTSARIAAE